MSPITILGRVGVAELLLEDGVNVDLVDISNKTALDLADANGKSFVFNEFH